MTICFGLCGGLCLTYVSWLERGLIGEVVVIRQAISQKFEERLLLKGIVIVLIEVLCKDAKQTATDYLQ